MNTAILHNMFDGATYVPERDDIRLTGQMLRVFDCMKDGQWRTLEQISLATGDPQASVSARIRDLKKERFGSYEVKREYVHRGLHRYRLVLPRKEVQLSLI